MSDDPIFSDKELFDQAGAGLVASLTLAVANSGAPLPVQGAMLVGGTFIGTGLARGVYRAASRRYPAFAGGFLRAHDPDPLRAGEKAQAVAKQGDAESLDDIMMRSFRMMMDAVDPAAVPLLGYMAGLYTFEGKKPDVFFRGFGRLLCELEPGEIEDLRTLVLIVCTFTDEWGAVSVEIDAAGKFWAHTGHSAGKGVSEPSPHAHRIFALLKREQFGGNTEPGEIRYGQGSPSSDVTIAIDPAIARQMFAIVMPPGAPLPKAD